MPLWFGMSPEFQANAKQQLGVDDEGLLVRLGDDFRRVFAMYAGPSFQLQAADATYRTPFGVERHGLGYGQPIRLPLAGASLREIHDYAWPDPAWMDVSQIRAKRWPTTASTRSSAATGRRSGTTRSTCWAWRNCC